MTPPILSLHLADIPTDQPSRRQFLQDIFGEYVMWNRSYTLETARRRLSDAEARSKVGSIFRKPYEDAANLSEEARAIAIKLAEKCVDDFAVGLMALLAGAGTDLRLKSGEAIRFPLDIELIDPESRNVILRERIGAGAGFLPDRWGRWLNHTRLDEGRPMSSSGDAESTG